MSYGKNDAHLTRIGGYGATSSQQMGNATRRQQGPSKGSPSWANNFQPTEGSPDYIRFIPGNYQAERINNDTGQLYVEEVPWFECAEHYHGGNKQSIVCSAGIYYMDEKRAQPCRGCDIWREDMKERRRIENETGVKPQSPNRISRSSKYVLLVLDMAWFFKGYSLDEHGHVRINKNTGKPFENWIKYNAAHQNEYQYSSYEAQRQNRQLEMRNGLVQTFPVGFSQFGTLNGYADVLEHHCKSCGGQNCVQTTGWVCPTCSAPTMTSSLPPAEMKKLTSQAIFCNNCRTMAYPRAMHSCGYCQNPAASTIYDVDLQIQTVRVNKNRQIIVPWMSNPRPMDQQYAKALEKPPDVVKKFAPTPYEEQIAKFGQPPYQAQAPAQQGWGQQQPQWGQPAQQWPQQHPAQAQQWQPQPQQQPQWQPAQTQQWQQPQPTWQPPAQQWQPQPTWNGQPQY